MVTSRDKNINITTGDALLFYDVWPIPTVIVSDGPYGIGGFPGDPPKPECLSDWYAPHILKWTDRATPQTTLWFWNTEHGWANVHPLLIKSGWDYVNCHIWNKGLGHVAGNANTKTLRKLPVVTEVCVQYVRRAEFLVGSKRVPMKEWLRYEWGRSGISFAKANEACGVRDAATRKYFAQCHLWYYPPPEAFERLSEYANKYGKSSEKPYFSLDGKKPITRNEWERMRAKFKCPYGVTNVWNYPPLNGRERLKTGMKALHLNQKPLKLLRLIIESSSDKHDVVWEPFGGLCSTAIACLETHRRCYAAEIDTEIFKLAASRLEKIEYQLTLNLE